jgi:hypothetical protein
MIDQHQHAERCNRHRTITPQSFKNKLLEVRGGFAKGGMEELRASSYNSG